MSLRKGILVGLVALAALACAPAAFATWPGANGKIAFECTHEKKVGICTVNPDVSELTLLLSNGERGPSWSADGKRLAFWYAAGEGQDYGWWIGTALADGTERRDRLAEGHAPAWTRDGRISYIDSDGQGNLWVMDPDGSNRQPLTTDARRGDFHPGYDTHFSSTNVIYGTPMWSPDGRHVALTRNVVESGCSGDACVSHTVESDVWVHTADGSARWRISGGQPDRVLSTRPTFWLADSSLVFTLSEWSGSGEHVERFRSRFDGSDRRTVRIRGGVVRISPDGQQLVSGGGEALITACLGNSDETRIPTRNAGVFDWQPLPGSARAGDCPDPPAQLKRKATAVCGDATCHIRLQGALRPPKRSLLRPFKRADACDGRIVAEVLAGAHQRARLTAGVRGDCRFRGTARWRQTGSRRVFTRRIRHTGSSWLAPSTARALRVRARRPT